MFDDSLLRDLLRHLVTWLSNLKRASEKRQRESIEALRAVVLAARHTRVYLRARAHRPDHAEEAKLAGMWTELAFRLSDLDLTRLAKRCDINGRYWADPDQFDDGFLQKADVGLARMEQLARQMLAAIAARK